MSIIPVRHIFLATPIHAPQPPLGYEQSPHRTAQVALHRTVGASYGALAQELQQVLNELICVLKESTVTGTAVHLQLALSNLAVHIV